MKRKLKVMTLGKAKTKAWKAFSIYIRTRDAFKTTGLADKANCVTCGRLYPISMVGGLQAGHFIQGRHTSVLFDERNCHAQCYGCNVMKKGNIVNYYEFMLKEYGQKVIDELKELDKKVIKMKPYMYLEIEKEYQDKLANLLFV